MAKLELNQVVKSFGAATILKGIDLSVEDGEFCVFVGPSGCGKSTLLRVIAGLEDATTGEIRIDDRVVNDVDAAKRGLSMVFQSYALYPHMTLRENMSFGLELARVDRAEIDRRIADAARILKIDHLLDRLPKTLSGGQRQRVAIGRSIVREPKIFLFDEPLSNLDAELRVQMRIELARLHERLGATMIYVTHDQVEAMTLADKIVVLRDGRIEQVGSPLELYNHPANLFVAGFIGSPRMNMLPATLATAGEDGTVVSLDGGTRLEAAVDSRTAPSGAALTLGIRPEHLHLAPLDQAVLSGKVVLTEQLGNETYLHLVVAGGESLVVQAPGQVLIRPGETIGLSVSAADCHLFGADERALPRAGARK